MGIASGKSVCLLIWSCSCGTRERGHNKLTSVMGNDNEHPMHDPMHDPMQRAASFNTE